MLIVSYSRLLEHVHEQNFEVRRQLDRVQDEMGEIEKRHQAKVAELDALVAEKIDVNKQLDLDLTIEKDRKERLETERTAIRKQYEDEKANWSELRGKMEGKLQKQQGQFSERIPFDPFGSKQAIILNAVKGDGRTRDKQIEII